MILYFYDSNHYCNASRQLLYYFILFLCSDLNIFVENVLYLFIYLLNYTEIKSFITVGKCMNVFYIYIYIYILLHIKITAFNENCHENNLCIHCEYI